MASKVWFLFSINAENASMDVCDHLWESPDGSTPARRQLVEKGGPLKQSGSGLSLKMEISSSDP